MVSLETEVAVDNADLGRMAYMSNARVHSKLKSTIRGTSADVMIWETNGGATPVNGYPFHVTNQVSSTLTKGSGSGVGVCSAIFFGNWADLIIGLWGGLDILVDPYTGGTSGTVPVDHAPGHRHRGAACGVVCGDAGCADDLSGLFAER